MNVKLSSALVHRCTSAPSVTVLGINIIHIAGQLQLDFTFPRD